MPSSRAAVPWTSARPSPPRVFFVGEDRSRQDVDLVTLGVNYKFDGSVGAGYSWLPQSTKARRSEIFGIFAIDRNPGCRLSLFIMPRECPADDTIEEGTIPKGSWLETSRSERGVRQSSHYGNALQPKSEC
jgi:hypothetical protein